MLQDTYGLNPRLLPKSLHDSYGAPKRSSPRIPHEEHEMNWVEAIKGKAEISSPVRVRRAAHRGHAARHRVAARRREDPLRRGQHEDHDAASANDFLSREYPQGWNLTL